MIASPSRAQVTQTTSVPAPIGGLNARDSVAAMPPTDAVTMENWFPTPTNITVRNGSTPYATGLPSWAETVMAYNAYTTAGNKLFAISGTGIYDVTAGGAVGAAVVSGLSNARWQHTNFATPGGQYLVAVNGTNDMELYNGTSWQAVNSTSTPIAITGVTTSSLIGVHPFKGRLFFIQKGSLSVWYLPVTQVGGAATQFDMSSLFRLGGYLVAMHSFNVDTVAGPQDYFAFISSEGEVLIYQGYDPNQVGSWYQVGTFRIGRPVGYRCVEKVGSDLYVICADGLFPLSKAMLTDRSQESAAISDKIKNLINTDVQQYGTHYGWQVKLYPLGNKILVNVPQIESQIQYQYVMNTITGAWTKFTGWNAACFELQGDKLYFGGNGTVIQCDTGNTDNNNAITTDLRPAFSYFGNPGENKQFTMARPVVTYDSPIGVSVILNVDYRDNPTTSQLNLPVQTGVALWNVALWNVSFWSSGTQLRLNWESVFGVGYAASLRIKTISKASNVSLVSIDYGYQRGGVL